MVALFLATIQVVYSGDYRFVYANVFGNIIQVKVGLAVHLVVFL